MRILFTAAFVLVASAALAEPQSPSSILASASPVARWVGWIFIDCVRAQASALGTRPEPKLTDADWRPSHARPTVEQEAAQAMQACSFEGEAVALEVSADTMKKLKASIEADAALTIRWERRKRDIWRVE
jgi:hypothetical protein